MTSNARPVRTVRPTGVPTVFLNDIIRSFAIIFVVANQMLKNRVKSHPFGLVLVVFEPIGLIIVLSAIYYFTSRRPVFGPSQILFHASGVVPFYWFVRISTRTRNMELDDPTRFPRIKPLFAFIAQVLTEVVIMVLVTVVVFTGIFFFGIPQALPSNMSELIGGTLALVGLAAGFGLTTAVLMTYLSFWGHVMAVCSRGLMVISGVFFIIDFMPPGIRGVLALNPISHGITWFRLGFYPTFPTVTLDKSYLVMWAVAFIALGILLERVTRRNRGLL